MYANKNRVRRSDLKSASSSRSVSPTRDPDLEARFRTKLEMIYGGSSQSPLQSAIVNQSKSSNDMTEILPSRSNDDGKENHGYAFRLFAPSLRRSSESNAASIAKPDGNSADPAASSSNETSLGPPTPKIFLSSSTPPPEGSGALLRSRSEAHYFTSWSPKWPRLQSQFVASAVSSSWVLSRSNMRFTGCELPWRVTTLVLPRASRSKLDPEPAYVESQFPLVAHEVEVEKIKKRTQPNKKRRIMIRAKTRQRQEATLKRAWAQDLRDREERERRTRRNRKKKVKRRAREKAKKVSMPTAAEEDLRSGVKGNVGGETPSEAR